MVKAAKEANGYNVFHLELDKNSHFYFIFPHFFSELQAQYIMFAYMYI